MERRYPPITPDIDLAKNLTDNGLKVEYLEGQPSIMMCGEDKCFKFTDGSYEGRMYVGIDQMPRKFMYVVIGGFKPSITELITTDPETQTRMLLTALPNLEISNIDDDMLRYMIDLLTVRGQFAIKESMYGRSGGRKRTRLIKRKKRKSKRRN